MTAKVKLPALCLIGFIVATATLSSEAPPRVIKEKSLNVVADEFRSRLGIPEQVSTTIVTINQYLVSVRRSPTQANQFIIEFDEKFLGTLSPQEQRAVIAHELGHVWIFTHHPYLQTEALANEVALRVIGRESLDKVYLKVQEREGQHGALLGSLPPARSGL